MDNSWYRIPPSKIRALASSLPTGEMRAHFMLLLMTYLDIGSLPDDDEELAFITSLPVSHIQAMRPYFRFIGRCEGGKLYLNCAEEIIMERVEYAEKKANAAAERWKGKECDASPEEAPQSPPKQRKAVHSSAKRRKAVLSQTDKHTDIHTNNQTDSNSDDSNESSGADAPAVEQIAAEESSRKPDILFVEFCQMFADAHAGEPYAHKSADFIKLAELRKRYAKAKPQPWEITPARFKQAAGNYFSSEVATHTLADLCVRFSAFFHNPLDRYNKPMSVSGSASEKASLSERNRRNGEEAARLLGINLNGQSGNGLAVIEAEILP